MNDTAYSAVKRSSFIHGICVNARYTVFNWSFWLSLVLIFFVFLINMTGSVEGLREFLHANAMNIVGISVSAIGIILAAIAVVVVIYKREDLARIVAADSRTFESFIFPYRFSASIWGLLAVVSLFNGAVKVDVSSITLNIIYLGWFWLFLYSILYSLYLIGEIIQQVILSSEIMFKNSR